MISFKRCSYFALSAVFLLSFALEPVAEAKSRSSNRSSGVRTTDYFTMLSTNGKVNKRECMMEGNQIVNGKLFGSGGACKRGVAYNDKYCPYGVGNRDNCLVPCVHGAGPRSKFGKSVKVPTFTCPWGPLKGKQISEVIVADTGDLGSNHIDIFKGICEQKKHDECSKWAAETTIASYGSGKGHEYQIAAELANRYFPGQGTTWLASLNGGGSQVAEIGIRSTDLRGNVAILPPSVAVDPFGTSRNSSQPTTDTASMR